MQYMIDEMQDMIDKQSEQLEDKDTIISKQAAELEALRHRITELEQK